MDSFSQVIEGYLDDTFIMSIRKSLVFEKKYLFVQDMGSFKHKVDDKLSLRKEAYMFLSKSLSLLTTQTSSKKELV